MPHYKCALKYQKEMWKCFFFEYIADVLEGDYFWVHSLYDSVFIEHNLGQDCMSFIFNHLNKCDDDSMREIEDYRFLVQSKIE